MDAFELIRQRMLASREKAAMDKEAGHWLSRLAGHITNWGSKALRAGGRGIIGGGIGGLAGSAIDQGMGGENNNYAMMLGGLGAGAGMFGPAMLRGMGRFAGRGVPAAGAMPAAGAGAAGAMPAAGAGAAGAMPAAGAAGASGGLGAGNISFGGAMGPAIGNLPGVGGAAAGTPGLFQRALGGWKRKLGLGATAGVLADWGANDRSESWNPLRRHADVTAGRTFNPLTWINPNSPEEAFANAQKGFNTRNDDLQSQIAEAYKGGDLATANRLKDSLRSGDFAGGKNRFSQAWNRWSPFGGSGLSLGQFSDAATNQIPNMEKSETGLQQHIDQRRSNMTPKDFGELNPTLQRHMTDLRKRLGDARQIQSIRGNMTGTTGATGQAAAGHWQMAPRPGNLGSQDFALDPWNGRGGWEDYVARYGQGATRPY